LASGKTIVLVSHDAAPSGCFARLEPILIARGYEVVKFIDHGKPRQATNDEIATAVRRTDILVLGISSSAELSESAIVAGRVALAARIVFGFYMDVPIGWTLGKPESYFAELASHTDFYCGVEPSEPKAARTIWRKAKFVVTGNPLREEMAFPRLSRDEVRGKFGLVPDEKAILFTTVKAPGCTFAQMGVLMEALAELATLSDVKFRLFISPHPGDRTPFAVDSGTMKPMRIYEEICALSPVSTCVVSAEIFAGSDLVPGMDLIVEFGSSLALQAGFSRVPVLTLGPEMLYRCLENVTGSRFLEAVYNGLSVSVNGNSMTVVNTIKELLAPGEDSSLLDKMIAHQQKFCRIPSERGQALRLIADLVDSF